MTPHIRPIWVALLVLSVCGPAAAADPPFTVLQVRLTISADEYAAMQPRGRGGFPGFGPAPKPPMPDPDGREVHRTTFGQDLPWATGDVAVGGETFKGVGVRYKGNGTIMDAARTVKKSFRINLEKNGGDGKFRGSKTINLHCGVADPSKYREVLGYALYRAAGVPAPKTTFAEVRLTVPGKHADELFGLYTVTEDVDKAFLRDRFGTDAGLLMKPEGVRDFEDRGDDWKRYKDQYRPKREPTADEAKRVIAFARLVHQGDDAAFRKDIAAYLDVDGYLRYLAVTAYIANIDSFFALGHNYYLYLHPKTGRLHFVPWDLDRAFANLPFLGTNEQKLDLSITRPYAGPHRLTERVLALPGMQEKYLALYKELAATVFSNDRLTKDLDAAEAAMKDLLARDAKAAAARKEAPQAAPPVMLGGTPDLRRFVEKRTASVAAQLAGTSKGFVPSAGFGMPTMGEILAGPLTENWDADKDGRLSRAEWVALAEGVFAKCTADKDGKVDRKALVAGLNAMLPKPPADAPPPPPGFSGGDMLAPPILAKADADKDGKLTKPELVKAAGAIFDEFDKKKAGKLEPAVLQDLLNAIFPQPGFGPPPAPPKKA